MNDENGQGVAGIDSVKRAGHSPESVHNTVEPAAGQPVEDVEDRENVSTVKPEDYPAADRAASRPS